MQPAVDATVVTLATLLHDIGKIGSRAFEGEHELSESSVAFKERMVSAGVSYGRHALYTHEFCETIKCGMPPELRDSDLPQLASQHHAPLDDIGQIIRRADELSLGIVEARREKPQREGQEFSRLVPIAATVFRSADTAESGRFAFKVKKYDCENLFPERLNRSEDVVADYQELWRGLITACRSISSLGSLAYSNVLVSLLERHCWSVPASAEVHGRDISLFDHLRSSAAIATCLQSATDSENPFLLASGSFGGIQQYISGGTAGAKGQARAMRGRSAGVSALSDSVAFSILHELGVSLSQVVAMAGGHFYMLLPNSGRTVDCLRRHRDQLHRWILDERHGRLRFGLVYCQLSAEDLRSNLSKVFDRIDEESFQERFRGLRPLKDANSWHTDEWVVPTNIQGDESVCRSCGIRASDSANPDIEENLCRSCMDDRSFGQEVVRGSFQVLGFDDSRRYCLPFSSSDVCDRLSETDRSADLILEFQGLLPSRIDLPLISLLRNTYVPLDSDQRIVDLGTIAHRSKGVAYLGCLRADVDNLGFIFSHGLESMPNDGDRHLTLSRIATLSRSLEYFFSGYLRHLLAEKYPYTYTLFSGGDDLVMFGPWNEILDLARVIRSEFARYTCFNPAWTLSAGVALAKPKTPLNHTLRFVNEALSRSKEREGKNVITAFNTTLSWPEFDSAINQAQAVAGWLNADVITSGQLYRMLHYSQEIQAFHDTKDTSHLRAIPQMIYDLARNWPEKNGEESSAKAWAMRFTDPERAEIGLLPFVCKYALCTVRE